MKKIKKIFLTTVSIVLLSGVFGIAVLANTDGRQQDPGGSCREITTGGGCFNWSRVDGSTIATHSNPTHFHRVSMTTHTGYRGHTPWRTPSFTGSARLSFYAGTNPGWGILR